jgi:hypothetical protein
VSPVFREQVAFLSPTLTLDYRPPKYIFCDSTKIANLRQTLAAYITESVNSR